MFLELSIGDVVKGILHLRLNGDLPNIRNHMVQLATGQEGSTLAKIPLKNIDDDSIHTENLFLEDMPVTPDSNETCDAKSR